MPLRRNDPAHLPAPPRISPPIVNAMDYQSFPLLNSIAQTTLLRGDFDLTVSAAASVMNEHRVSSIVIEQRQGKYIFSVEDLLEFVHGGGAFDTPLRKIPTHSIDCLPGTERVLAAFELMEARGQRHLGVLNPDGVLSGIVTFSDILHSIDPSVLMEKKTVGDIVTRKIPTMYTADWVLEDVVHHIKKQEDSIVVVEAGKAAGIITAKDIFCLVTSGDSMDQPLSHYMSSPVITTPTHFTISNALMQLRQYNIKRAIVVDEQERVIGVLKQSELVGFAYGAWVNLIKNHTAELHELVGILEERSRGLERLTTTDTLTGLGNRRALHYRMQEEIDRMKRYNSHAFSLIIIDLDHFKVVNDTYGHLIGDEVLVAIAGVLQGVVRKCDAAVRWGGEEFAVLLANTSLLGAAVLANRLREIVAELTFHDDIRVTISAGIGEYLESDDESTFFQRVDRALYRAKSHGRNRVEMAEGL
jgi:diguanylate cyclase (GGDEF)-like protein